MLRKINIFISILFVIFISCKKEKNQLVATTLETNLSEINPVVTPTLAPKTYWLIDTITSDFNIFSSTVKTITTKTSQVDYSEKLRLQNPFLQLNGIEIELETYNNPINTSYPIKNFYRIKTIDPNAFILCDSSYE